MTAVKQYGKTIHFAGGVTPVQLSLGSSDCGQYLLIRWQEEILAVHGAMGCDVDYFEFENGERLDALELIERIEAAKSATNDVSHDIQ